MQYWTHIIFSIFCFLAINTSNAQEICNNAIDDDGDGLVDLLDILDCNCLDTIILPPSLIPNPSFELTNCCPSGFSQLNCADGWIQGSYGTTDYYNHCDSSYYFHPSPQFPVPSGGNGYVGFYVTNTANGSEFSAACLNGTLIAGQSYTILFYTAYSVGNLVNDLSIFGSPNCSDIPWTTPCPIGFGSWQTLSSQSVTYASNGAWQQVIMTFTPTVNINAIAIGGSCSNIGIQIPSSWDYYYLDELTINSTALFTFIETDGNYCDTSLVLSLNSPLTVSNLQWYKDSIALVGAQNDSLVIDGYNPGMYTVTFEQSGVCMSKSIDIVSPTFPIAYAIPAIDSLCEGESAFLLGDTSLSPVNVDNWYWDLQDGSPKQHVYHLSKQLDSAGTYLFKFFVDSLGCMDSVEFPVVVHSVPTVQMAFSANGVLYQPTIGDTITVCNPDSVFFQNLSAVLPPSSLTLSLWNFGDMNTSNLGNPSHHYATDGLYIVKLMTESDKGCQDSSFFVLEILSNPVADFSISGNACENEWVDFINFSTINTGSIVSYDWDFGDFGQSTSISPPHQYATDGIYDVELIVESDLGCSDTVVKSLTIFPAPTANFQIVGHCQNDTVSFVDQSIVASGSVSSWQWSFGDGHTANAADTANIYSSVGTYFIELVVETNQGCTDTLDSLHLISASPQASFILNNHCENESIQVINTSSISAGSMIYDWVFENNGGSSLASPLPFSYANSGLYKVHLTLVSDQGCSSVITQNLEIYPTPIAAINGSSIEGCSPLLVNLSNAEDPNITSCLWDLGDGTLVDNCGVVPHLFQTGIYDVSLNVYTQYNCTNSVIESGFVEVTQTPFANFFFSPDRVSVLENEVSFFNTSEGATDFIWNFGNDLGISTAQNPILTLPKIAKTYSFKLTAISENGLCSDETTQSVKMFDELLFYVPNSFTPNGNGLNEHFLPVMTAGINVYNYQLTVFNRWGEVMFISRDPMQGWDGTYNGQIVKDGTYIWQIDYRLLSYDSALTERGTINVIR